jgi:hypothetical protein
MQNVSKVNLSFKNSLAGDFAMLLAVITLFRRGVRGWKIATLIQVRSKLDSIFYIRVFVGWIQYPY